MSKIESANHLDGARRSHLGNLVRGGVVLLALGAQAAAAGDPPVEEIWADARLSEAYLGFEVSLGNNGGMTFSDTGFVDSFTRLYTSLRGTEPSPLIWEQSRVFQPSYNRSVDSADLADVHAVVRHQGSTAAELRGTLEIYRSAQNAPVHTHLFPTGDTGNGINWCHVTPDGSSVLASASKGSTTWVKQFDANSSGPGFHEAGSWTVTTFGAPRSYGISSDLRLLYLGNIAESRVVDLFTGATVFQTYLIGGSAESGHAFSEDGRRFAVPAGDRIRLFEASGNTFVERAPLGSPSSSSNQVASHAAFSADGSTLAGTFYVDASYDEVSIGAWNLDGATQSSPTQVLGKRYLNSGPYANFATDIAISTDGCRVALSMQAPELNSVPGVAVFARDSFERPSGPTPFADFYELERDGSVYEIDMSPDGTRLAIARRRGYPGTGFGEKIIEAVDLGKDFAVRGDARVGGTVVFEFYPELDGVVGGLPHSYVLASSALESPPKILGIGTLYVLRTDVSQVYMGLPDSTGKATSPEFHVRLSSVNDGNPEIVGPIGSTRYFQALRTSSRLLSDSWAAVTILAP